MANLSNFNGFNYFNFEDMLLRIKIINVKLDNVLSPKCKYIKKSEIANIKVDINKIFDYEIKDNR